MGAPVLQEDAGDRDIPCRVAPLQSSTAFLPAYVVHQHPYSGTNLVGHGSHAWKTSGARCRRINQKSRVTYSVITKRLHDDVMRAFIERELDSLGLAHRTFTAGATELIVRSADGVLRKCRNLCLASMLEAVRASAGTTIDIDLVNRVLLQPHWQNEVDLTDF